MLRGWMPRDSGRGRISSVQCRFKGAYEATLAQEVVMLKQTCNGCTNSDREDGVRTFQRSLLWLLLSLLCLCSARWLSIISTLNRQHLFWNFATPLWEGLLFCECTVEQVCGFELRLHSATLFVTSGTQTVFVYFTPLWFDATSHQSLQTSEKPLLCNTSKRLLLHPHARSLYWLL